MIPPECLFTILKLISEKGLHEAFQQEFLTASYSFKIVTIVHATQQGLLIELNILRHPPTDGLYYAFRAVATLRPIGGTNTWSRYHLKKNRFLVAGQGRRYAEAQNWEIASECEENSNLRLCQRAFASTSRPKTTC